MTCAVIDDRLTRLFKDILLIVGQHNYLGTSILLEKLFKGNENFESFISHFLWYLYSSSRLRHLAELRNFNYKLIACENRKIIS